MAELKKEFTVHEPITKGSAAERSVSRPSACYGYSVTLECGRPSMTLFDRGCYHVTGYHREEFARDPVLWYRIIHPEDREAVIEQADAVLSGKSCAALTYRIIHRDGGTRTVRNAIVLRCDANGTLMSYDGLISLLSEEERKTQVLLQVRRRIDKSTRN